MEVKYRLIKIDPEEHSIVVRYFTSKITEEMLAIEFDENGNVVLNEEGYPTRCRTDYNLNIFQVPSPSQEEIQKLINYNAPIEWLSMQESIRDPNVDTSLSNIAPMVNQVGDVVKPDPTIPLFDNV